ncbi:MAG: hypothetical protein JNG83_08880, partial [Opitutaceae bacterium]|nr:hypothetical protein [Opitutaceae bacterium]
ATSDITSDVRDIHPTNKRDVGLRFARLALADTYGRADIAAQAPRLASSKRPWRGRALEISLAHADGLRSRDGQPLAGFTIAGEDRVFHPAEAVIRDGRLVVSSPRVARPAAVRFAWHETAMPNLVNAAGLPALPFRTDAWPLVLEVPKAPAADAQAP